MPANTGSPRRSRTSAPGLLILLLLGIALCVAGALRSPAATRKEPPAAVNSTPASAGASPAAESLPRSPAPADLDAPGPGAQNVGSQFCGAPACHGAMMADFNALRHSHYVSDPKYKDAATCELCHGPASNHVADPQHRHIYRLTEQTPENTHRINEACLSCHQDMISRTHYLATEHARAGVSCASCHEVHYPLDAPYLLRYPGVGGPAGAPVSAGTAKRHGRPVTTPAPAPAAPAAAPPAAGAPAAGTPARPRFVNLPRLASLAKTRVPIPNWRSSFTREAGAITDEQAINEMCASCHRQQVSEFRQISHHPLFEGRLDCIDCHDPHRGEQGRMLKARTIADTCIQCHQNQRGPFIYEHDPVKAGGIGDQCLECHRPHGSPNRHLGVLFSRGLCVQCHTDIQQDPAHQARGGDCWRSGCHVAIHGSNRSPLFFVE